MRIRTVIGVLLVVATAAFFSGRAVSEEGKEGDGGMKGMTAEQEAEMMKKWMEFATPGAPHAMLGKLEGKWDISSTGMMGDAKGTATFTKVLGGRYVRQDFAQEIPEMGPFNGIGYLGYNNLKKKYVMTWMDTWGTAITQAEGLASADGKSVHFWGSMDEMTGEHDKPVVYKHKTISDDKFIFEIHDPHMGMGGDGSTLVMQVTYTRSK